MISIIRGKQDNWSWKYTDNPIIVAINFCIMHWIILNKLQYNTIRSSIVHSSWNITKELITRFLWRIRYNISWNQRHKTNLLQKITMMIVKRALKWGNKFRERDLGEGSALSPDGAIGAEDGSGREMLTTAVDVTHQMLINVSLPRHFEAVFVWDWCDWFEFATVNR